MASFLLAYLGYIFFLKLYFSYLGSFCFSYVSYEKAYDWIFKKCSFFPVYWPRNLIHSYYWILSWYLCFQYTILSCGFFFSIWSSRENPRCSQRKKRCYWQKKKKKKTKQNIREKNFQRQYKMLKDNRTVSLVLRENYF